MPTPPASFTGRRRTRRTRFSVKVADALARTCITIGGFGTIIAVTTVCIFLVAVVVPLFLPASSEPPIVSEILRAGSAEPGASPPPDATSAVRRDAPGRQRPVHIATDEYNLLAWTLSADGRVEVIQIDTGDVIDVHTVAPGIALTAWSLPQRGDLCTFGYADGTVRLARIGFALTFMEIDEAPEPLRDLDAMGTMAWERGLAQRTREGQVRILRLAVDLLDPIDSGTTRPIIRLDHTGTAERPVIAWQDADDVLRYGQLRSRRNLMTGRTTLTASTHTIPFRPRPTPPAFLRLTGLGDNIYLIWADGVLHRYDVRDPAAPTVAEEVDLVPEQGWTLSAVGFLIGKTTLVTGDDHGGATTWFRTRVEGAPTADGLVLRRASRLDGAGAGPVRSISSSQRKRILAIGHEDGRVRLHNVTNERFLGEVDTIDAEPVHTAVLGPRDNAVVALAGDRIYHWEMHTPHPEASPRAIFGKVWYEGYEAPAHVWQSTGGTDDFESKYGLVPLIFGTIKGTFYSLLFGVPLALLAAVYTSEFLHRRVRAIVKPSVEMMASLPSVVLGFLAGLIVAPYIETIVPTALAALVTIPLSFLLLAYAWQMLPSRARIRFDGVRILFIFGGIPLGIRLASLLGPVAEAMLFEVRVIDPESGAVTAVLRDFRLWLNAGGGNPAYESSPVGGWLMLFLPLSALLVGIASVRLVNPFLMLRSERWSRRRLALADAGKFISGAALTLGLALLLSAAASLIHDPRGLYIDTYVQRNALIVGFIMGFAIIPIIYTIADDAMGAVPEHLRSASLGAGATRWQTAVRIVLPTAMSGLFSAVMVGFGRAVGETMIVLMATGNTPVMEWNIFSGFRTLSANIAVELPEAVKDSTNYRMLFLAALVLFVMTFVINTIAEFVRQRYRRRAYQL